MATFTKRNWITGEVITDTKLNNEKGYCLLETDNFNLELQVGMLTIDDLLNIIEHFNDGDNEDWTKLNDWTYDSSNNYYYCSQSLYYNPSTGMLYRGDNIEPV